ncbi:MAG: SusC/RagA family TonB-linked outer membrane protein [Pedobacter sp.]|nr:MAG: SusC/RagA family TonB-linked outer membrane protein [Pedobacter sp.]
MYKNFTAFFCGTGFRATSKILFRTMKLVILFWVTALFQVSAASTYAQNVNINVKSTSLESVLDEFRRQSGYHFLYDEQAMRRAGPVTLKLSNTPLKEAMEICLANQPLTYVIQGKDVIIKPKPNIELNKLFLVPITGRVTDESGQPLAGVSILVKGTQKTAQTDDKGSFKIDVELKQTLIIRYIGYTPKEIVVENTNLMNIVLQSSVTELENVIVTGYGSQKKIDIISSIGTVNVGDLQKAPVKSLEEALAGRIAGVQVSSSQGGPLAAVNIVIRGNSSLTQDNSPLWVIDGFPIENPDNNAINPKDIEEITILKDAASTAIYGSRGANGVILITTKSGKAGAPVIAFNATSGFQRTLKRMELMNPLEFVQLQTSYVGASGTNAKIFYTPGDESLIGNPFYVPGGRTLESYRNVPFVNWQEELYRDAPFQDFSLSLSGGTDKTRYLISGSNTKQVGTIINSDFTRYQGKVVLNQEISKRTKVGFNFNFANTFTNGNNPSSFSATSPSFSLLYAVWGYRPATSSSSSVEDQLNNDIDPDGQLEYAYNPVRNTRNTLITAQRNNVLGNGFLEQKILNNLTLRITGGINYTQLLRKNFSGSNTQGGGPQSALGPNGAIANTEVANFLNENTLNYTKVIKRHTIGLLGGFSVQKIKTQGSSASASQVPNDDLGPSGIDEGTPYGIGSSSSNSFLNSYFVRANYKFNSKYYFSGTLRADGSSKFAPQNRWGYFPSAAVSWNVAQEDFLKKSKTFSNLKLRYSYGTSGNNRVNDFAYLFPIILSNDAHYAFGNTYYKGAVLPTLGNLDLRWETTATSDAGIDIGILKNKVELTVDYYRKVTKDLLIQATTPGHIGYMSGINNIGSVSNTGLEFSLNTVNVNTKKFNWNSNFNISFNKNKVLSLTSGQQGLTTQVNISTTPAFPYIAQVGGPIAQFIGYKWIGNYQYSDFDQLPNGSYILKGNIASNGNRSTIQPGDIKYEDINGDGIITDADKIVIGNPNPKFFGGFTNNFTYLGFDLNVLLTFSYGNDIYNANRLVFEGAPLQFVNQFATFNNRWTPTNQTNDYPRAGGASTRPAESSRVVEDGSFLRLQTVSLGYNLPSSLMQKINVKNARVFCSAQNLAVWTKYQGSDPEVSTRPGALTPGFDIFAYPRAFTMTFGVNFSF